MNKLFIVGFSAVVLSFGMADAISSPTNASECYQSADELGYEGDERKTFIEECLKEEQETLAQNNSYEYEEEQEEVSETEEADDYEADQDEE